MSCKFQLGDVVRHKATGRQYIVAELSNCPFVVAPNGDFECYGAGELDFEALPLENLPNRSMSIKITSGGRLRDTLVRFIAKHYRCSSIGFKVFGAGNPVYITADATGGYSIGTSPKPNSPKYEEWDAVDYSDIGEFFNHVLTFNPTQNMGTDTTSPAPASNGAQNQVMNAAMDVPENIRLRRKYGVIDVEGRLTQHGRELVAQLTFQGTAAGKMAEAIDGLLANQDATA